jgi:hypothetical protein
MSGHPGGGLDTKEKAVAVPKFVDFAQSPTPFTHIHGWKSVCVRGSETGAKLRKIYTSMFLLNLLAGEVIVVFEIGR